MAAEYILHRFLHRCDHLLVDVAEKFHREMQGGRLNPGHAYVLREFPTKSLLQFRMQFCEICTERFGQIDGEKSADHGAALFNSQRRTKSNAACDARCRSEERRVGNECGLRGGPSP